MPHYERIKSELAQDLEQLTPVIRILDELRSTGRTASTEESKEINDISIVHSSEVVALMLESKAQKRNARLRSLNIDDREYNPFILTTDKEVEDFNKYLSGLPDGQKFHYDLILRPQDVHSTALQIHSDGSIASSFFIDSLSDTNKEERSNLEKALGGQSYNYVQGKILNSDSGCSIFSIQHLNSMNRFINEKNKSIYLKSENNSLEDLDPILLKHIQSRTTAKKYEDAHLEEELFIDKKHSKTFRKHLNDFTATISIVNKDNTVELKQRNYSILYKTEKYLREGLRTLEEIHRQENGDQKLEEVLSHRSGHNIIESVYQKMGLTSDQTLQVQGLYNQDQINLALQHGIPKSDIELAKCFSSKEMSRLVYNFIGRNDLSPQKAFNRVKNFSNPYQFHSTFQLGLNDKEVAESKFLSSKTLAPGSFKYLHKWHNKSGTNGVSAAFETIRMFESYNPREYIAIEVVKDLCNKDSNEFLQFSIIGQSSALIKLWLDAGASINKNTNGSTPIMQAIQTGNPKIIKQIIMAGATIPSLMDKKYKKHFTIEKLSIYLKEAIDQENSKAVHNIVRFSPDILKHNIEGYSPLEYAIQQNKLKLLKELFPQGNNISYIAPKIEKENLSMKDLNITPLQKRKILGSKINL